MFVGPICRQVIYWPYILMVLRAVILNSEKLINTQATSTKGNIFAISVWILCAAFLQLNRLIRR